MKTQENAMKTSQKNSKTTSKMGDRLRVRYLTMTAMLSAISFILMFFQFSIPFVPSFVKMDLSELPALIGAFAMGPVYGTPRASAISASKSAGTVCGAKRLMGLPVLSIRNFVKFHLMPEPKMPPCFRFKNL